MDLDKIIKDTREVTIKGLSDAAQGAAVAGLIVGIVSIVMSINRLRAGKPLYKPAENTGTP